LKKKYGVRKYSWNCGPRRSRKSTCDTQDRSPQSLMLIARPSQALVQHHKSCLLIPVKDT
jgi:hypothetical protein